MIDLLEVFQARCESRAMLWQIGECDFHDAIDELQVAAEQYELPERIGQDAVQAIIAEAFAAVLDPEIIDSGIESTPVAAAKSTLDAAAWLWFQVEDEIRFRRFLRRHSETEIADIVAHIRKIKAKRNA
jgi:hypothetical protein